MDRLHPVASENHCRGRSHAGCGAGLGSLCLPRPSVFSLPPAELLGHVVTVSPSQAPGAAPVTSLPQVHGGPGCPTSSPALTSRSGSVRFDYSRPHGCGAASRWGLDLRSLRDGDVGASSTCFLAIGASSLEKWLFWSFARFLIGPVFSLLLGCKKSLFWMRSPRQIYDFKCFLPFYGLSFHVPDSVLRCAIVLIFVKKRICFCCCCSCLWCQTQGSVAKSGVAKMCSRVLLYETCSLGS